jgi:hypothetical protein
MVFGWFKKSAQSKQGRQKAKPEFADTAPPKAPAPAPVDEEQVLRQHRSQLYETIRECMIASGILSAGYKFKILSADSANEQFLVLFDLASVFQSHTEQLCQMEQLIQTTALNRYDLVVKTCYWRVVPDPLAMKKAAQQQAPEAPQPDPSAQARAQLNELFANDEKLGAREPESEFAPTQFSNSLAPLHGNEKAASSKSYVLLTGFEDTEIANSSFKPSSFKDKR